MELFLTAHKNYDYDELYNEMENIRKKEGELICHTFHENGKPFIKLIF